MAKAGRRALGLRYRLLTYMYYHFDRAAAAGAPVARPLWFEFPADAAARSADSQWLLGDSVLVSPVLEQARLLPSSPGFLGFGGIRQGPESQGRIECPVHALRHGFWGWLGTQEQNPVVGVY